MHSTNESKTKRSSEQPESLIFGAKAGLCSKLRSLSPDQLLVGLQHNLEPC